MFRPLSRAQIGQIVEIQLGRLRKLLAEERRSLQQVRQNYNNEIGSRTEIELVLRECVEEVRKEGERR